jgi:hypothetical protein
MRHRWHEQIQRCANGQSSAAEIAELHKALSADAELRALYLDYLNLDMALSATADAAVTVADDNARIIEDSRRIDRQPAHLWRWAAGAAACALLVILVMPSKRQHELRAQHDLAAAAESAQQAITRLPSGAPAGLPAWMSPTASLLDQPTSRQ